MLCTIHAVASLSQGGFISSSRSPRIHLIPSATPCSQVRPRYCVPPRSSHSAHMFSTSKISCAVGASGLTESFGGLVLPFVGIFGFSFLLQLLHPRTVVHVADAPD